MGTGYTRNDTSNNIADGNIINASDLDGEFDAVESAFNESTGHTHDGTAAEGAPITVLGPVQDFVASATEIKPKTTNTLDIGTVSLQFKDMYLDGTAYLDDIQAVGAVDITGDLDVDNININGNTISSTDTNGNITLAPDGTGVVALSSTDLTFGDNDKAIFGAGSDLQIYHSGVNSFISDAGTGDLFIQAQDLTLRGADASTRYLTGVQSTGAVTAFYGNAAKLATTATGVDVTGTLNITGDGDDLIVNSADYELALLGNRGGTGVDLDKAYFRMKAEGTNTIVLDTAGSSYFNGGNVGIGTSSPSHTLDVQGDVDTWVSRIYNTGSDANAQGLLVRSDATSAHDATAMGVYADGDYKMVVKSTGNVGIGVSTVSGKLHLSESGATNEAATIFSLDGYHSTFGANLAKSSGTYTTPATSLSGGAWEYQAVNSIGSHGDMLYLSASDTNTSASSPVERMRIDGSGSVGIGTSSIEGSNKLDVRGWGTFTHPSGDCNLKIQVGNTTGFSVLQFGDTADTDAGYVAYNHADNYMSFRTNGSGEDVRITSGGNVGIGTTTPSDRLHVNGGNLKVAYTYASLTLSSSSSGTGFVNFGDTDNDVGQISYDHTNNRMVFRTNAVSNRMVITSAGNIGIGTASPSADVHIVGASFGDYRVSNSYGSTLEMAVYYGNSTVRDSSKTSDAGINFRNSSVVPGGASSFGASDNVLDLGESSYRWDDVYATNGTIQTSDVNLKQQIAPLTDAEITAAKAISALFKTYKWNDSVAEKGDAARTHAGVVAQEVEAAMTTAGLDASDYAFFISTTWWEADVDYPAIEAVEEVLDENGRVVTPAVEAQEAATVPKVFDTLEEAPEGATERNRKGIRYPELLAFIGAATEQRLTNIETRLAALEAN